MFGRKRRQREREAVQNLRFALGQGRKERLEARLSVEARDAILAHMDKHGTIDPLMVLALNRIEETEDRLSRQELKALKNRQG